MARDTKARHGCGFPAPSFNQLKGLRDVRHYTDAEQALIMRRLLAPYNCALPSLASPVKPASVGPKPVTGTATAIAKASPAQDAVKLTEPEKSSSSLPGDDIGKVKAVVAKSPAVQGKRNFEGKGEAGIKWKKPGQRYHFINCVYLDV